MKGLGALQRHQLPHPPYKNPGSATKRPAYALRAGEVISYTVSQRKTGHYTLVRNFDTC